MSTSTPTETSPAPKPARTERQAAEKVPTLNREGIEAYNITWPWERGSQEPGMAAVLRVKNEAQSLPHVLPPLFEAGLKEVHIVDNQSTDGTDEVAQASAASVGRDQDLHIHQYPHSVSRCGAEHLATPPDSLASLPYFYNWAFSQPNTTYALKWDGDMVLTPLGVAQLRRLNQRITEKNVILRIPRHPVYVKDEREAWIDLGSRNTEAFGRPQNPAYAHVKAMDWEILLGPEQARYLQLRQGSCLELKWLSEDEFSHWTAPEEFTDARSRRKQREWLIHSSLSAGEKPPVAGLIHVTSPDETHVVDYLKDTWLPAAPRPLIASAIAEDSQD